VIKATYIATRPQRDPEVLAEHIAREQSLETPRELISPAISQRYLGRVLDVTELAAGRWSMRIGYPAELASGQLGQLVHLLWGNVSFYPRIRLVDVELPRTLLDELGGPRGGIPGIREYIDVHDRGLLMSVLKPRGTPPQRLADIALRFARAGGDLLKDDQNLVERELDVFTNRINLCAQSIEKAADITGRRCLYLPHVAGSGDWLDAQLEVVAERGLAGVVMCPWVMGLETASNAARRHGLMWLAHPAFSGSLTEPADHGIRTAVALGTLVRLAGADISIFPGSGGRIQSRQDDSTDSCRALTQPLGSMRPTLPCIGGGKTLDHLPQALQELGSQAAILVGGDLLARGDAMEADLAATIERLETLSRE